MLKKQLNVLIVLFGLLFAGSTVNAESTQPSMMELVGKTEYTVNPADQPKGAVLIDANTGKLLWSENADAPRNPASIMKLMTLYLFYDAMHNNKFSMDTEITATPRHESIANIYALSNNKIKAGVAYPVKELIPMVLVPSSNVATIMLSELVDENPVRFIELMNEKAKELGMTNTHIYNATGAQISAFDGFYAEAGVDQSGLQLSMDNETTARDIGILTYYFLNKFPEVLDFTKDKKITVMENTPYTESFDSYNYSLPNTEYPFEGVDGLKTGSSQTGGFNIDMTAKQGDLRLIAVVLGVGDWSDQSGEYKRHPFSNAIMKYGFENFAYQEVLAKGKQEVGGKELVLKESLKDTVRKGDKVDFDTSNQVVQVKQDLPQVSDLIKPQSIDYTTAAKEAEMKEQEATAKKAQEGGILSFLNKIPGLNRLGIKDPVILGIIACLIVLVLLLLLFVILSIRSARKRKRIRQRHRRSR